MFDELRFQDALENYKKAFAETWQGEKYKWEAVKCFQDNWDVNAEDFAGMLKLSLSKTYNLLASRMNYPAATLNDFAGKYPEDVRARKRCS
jgi:5-methylcytosine-specific restriction protein B